MVDLIVQGKTGACEHDLDHVEQTGPLTPEEMDVMKTQVLRGGKLLSSKEGMTASRMLPVSLHHEKLTGRGSLGYGWVESDRRPAQTFFTTKSLINMLDRLGVTVTAQSLRVENIAAVMVTAELPSFARAGSRLDCTVSSIGDARSLQGGLLVQTPLKAANGQGYAVAQGSIVIGGFSAGNSANGVQVNHPTVGRVMNGGIVEREVASDLMNRDHLELVLRESDFTTASRLEAGINQKMGAGSARSLDGRTVSVRVPAEYKERMIDLIAELENIQIETDRKAKVVLNARTVRL
jgi:flagellar P-ring protein FlgI